MSNINPIGSAKFWFDGDTASSIDSGAPVPGASNVTNNWVGSTNYWYRGTPQGYLQGGTGSVADSPENISLLETTGPTVDPPSRKSRAYAIIL